MEFLNITSRNNSLIKEIVKLSERKNREKEGLFCFEGRKLFSEAISHEIPLEYVLVTEEFFEKFSSLSLPCPLCRVSREVYEKISFEKSPEGVFCVSKALDKFHILYIIYKGSFSEGPFVILDGIRDPGNLGTVLRTASAFGIKKVVLSDDCADIYNPKTIRASMGALFRTRTVRVSDLPATILALRDAGLKVYGAALDERALSLTEVDAGNSSVFVIGNEGNGIRPDVLNACDGSVIIPMEQGTESLNAASAATVLLWERYRSTLGNN